MHYDSFIQACDNAGIGDLINKRDIKDVFNIRKVAGSSKLQIIRGLTSLAFIATLPIVWPTAIGTALAVALIAATVWAVLMALMVVTMPIWGAIGAVTGHLQF